MIIAITRSRYLESLKALGIKAIVTNETGEQLWKKLRNHVAEYKALIIEEDLYKSIETKLKRYFQGLRYPPLLIIVPNVGEKQSTRLKDMYEYLSTAVGVKLKVGAYGSGGE
ncbi:MAG: hypothetical protein DRJ37_00080 [Thermoprotei archaeon]|nr:MAG: hypothetical protein DRJ37_00080 [Thermoprotei archaeon]